MSNNNIDPARKLARVLEQGKAEVQFKQTKEVPVAAPRKPKPTPTPKPRPRKSKISPKPAQRGRSDNSSTVRPNISRTRRGQAMKVRPKSRSASVTREPPLPTDPGQLAELKAFKQQLQQEQVNSWNALQKAPKSRMTEGEKGKHIKDLANEDKKRREFEENSRRQLEELEANRKRLQKREQELKRQQAELDRKQAEFEKLKAAADLNFQAALETGQGKPNAYTTRTLAAEGPGPGYEVGPLPFLRRQTGSVSQSGPQSHVYASITEGKKKKNRKRSVKNKKGNKKKKKGGKVSKKN